MSQAFTLFVTRNSAVLKKAINDGYIIDITDLQVDEIISENFVSQYLTQLSNNYPPDALVNDSNQSQKLDKLLEKLMRGSQTFFKLNHLCGTMIDTLISKMKVIYKKTKMDDIYCTLKISLLKCKLKDDNLHFIINPKIIFGQQSNVKLSNLFHIWGVARMIDQLGEIDPNAIKVLFTHQKELMSTKENRKILVLLAKKLKEYFSDKCDIDASDKKYGVNFFVNALTVFTYVNFEASYGTDETFDGTFDETYRTIVSLMADNEIRKLHVITVLKFGSTEQLKCLSEEAITEFFRDVTFRTMNDIEKYSNAVNITTFVLDNITTINKVFDLRPLEDIFVLLSSRFFTDTLIVDMLSKLNPVDISECIITIILREDYNQRLYVDRINKIFKFFPEIQEITYQTTLKKYLDNSKKILSDTVVIEVSIVHENITGDKIIQIINATKNE